DRVELVVRTILPERRPFLSIALATAIPKGKRFDWLVEKATEVGVEHLVPIVSARSIVEPGSPRIERLERSIIEACKQCRRDRLMVLESPKPWDQVVLRNTSGLRFLADPAGVPPSSWPEIPKGA